MSLNSIFDSDFPFFEVGHINRFGQDKLYDALSYSKDDVLTAFDNEANTDWDDLAANRNFQYDPFLADTEAVTIIGDHFSNDLDLYWTLDDELTLFDYDMKEYVDFCDLALLYLQTNVYEE